MYSGEVWVFAEQGAGEINPVSYELLGKARELAAQVDAKVGAVLVGENPASQVYVRAKQKACQQAGLNTEDGQGRPEAEPIDSHGSSPKGVPGLPEEVAVSLPEATA